MELPCTSSRLISPIKEILTPDWNLFSPGQVYNNSKRKAVAQIFVVRYSVANGSVIAKGIRRKYSILPRLTTKKAICTGNKVITKCYNRQTIFPKILSASVNLATPRERRVQAHLELAELVEILSHAYLLCAEIGHAIGFSLA
ncbi:hypothetical protein NQ317_014002 [Molorchus minor]|uniref:Uncharacterized protein n=1 Tax=Molorchus minor TaxID=1323400 RepID=A0ABQ9J2E1_9CUCU|nr:hypothetical protein NQ317_014002 [Molorchus minor]